MTREQYVKQLIAEKGLSLKSFAADIEMPYTTLLSMLKNGLGGAAIDNVIRVCRGLGISVDDLEEHTGNALHSFCVSDHEQRLIIQYRNLPEMRAAVDRLLQMEDLPDGHGCRKTGV